jgi:hypothetical protein
MLLEGPSQARLADTVTYELTYDVRNVPGTDVVVGWSDDQVLYQSSELQSGEGNIVGSAASYVRWSLSAGSGILSIVLQVPAGLSPRSFTVSAFEPGTQTTSSNVVTTTVVE